MTTEYMLFPDLIINRNDPSDYKFIDAKLIDVNSKPIDIHSDTCLFDCGDYDNCFGLREINSFFLLKKELEISLIVSPLFYSLPHFLYIIVENNKNIKSLCSLLDLIKDTDQKEQISLVEIYEDLRIETVYCPQTQEILNQSIEKIYFQDKIKKTIPFCGNVTDDEKKDFFSLVKLFALNDSLDGYEFDSLEYAEFAGLSGFENIIESSSLTVQAYYEKLIDRVKSVANIDDLEQRSTRTYVYSTIFLYKFLPELFSTKKLEQINVLEMKSLLNNTDTRHISPITYEVETFPKSDSFDEEYSIPILVYADDSFSTEVNIIKKREIKNGTVEETIRTIMFTKESIEKYQPIHQGVCGSPSRFFLKSDCFHNLHLEISFYNKKKAYKLIKFNNNGQI